MQRPMAVLLGADASRATTRWQMHIERPLAIRSVTRPGVGGSVSSECATACRDGYTQRSPILSTPKKVMNVARKLTQLMPSVPNSAAVGEKL